MLKKLEEGLAAPLQGASVSDDKLSKDLFEPSKTPGMVREASNESFFEEEADTVPPTFAPQKSAETAKP